MKEFYTWFTSNAWLTAIILYVVAGAVLSLLEYFLSYRLYPTYERKNMRWHMAIAQSLHTPAQVYIWLMVFLLCIPKLLHPIGFRIDSSLVLHVIRDLVTAVFAFWFFMRFIKRIEASFYQRITQGVGKITR